MNKKHSYFITVEGIEGVGKSTAVKSIQAFLEGQGIALTLTREPGGTAVAEDIRQILLHQLDEVIVPDTELLLMFASRAQHIATVIKPALAEGRWVVSDRFTDASYAYQGGGRGIESDRIAVLEDWVHADLQPDVTFLLDASTEIALERAKLRSTPDRIESEAHAFFERVRQAYLDRAKNDPKRFIIIDATLELSVVQSTIEHHLKTLLS